MLLDFRQISFFYFDVLYYNTKKMLKALGDEMIKSAVVMASTSNLFKDLVSQTTYIFYVVFYLKVSYILYFARHHMCTNFLLTLESYVCLFVFT